MSYQSPYFESAPAAGLTEFNILKFEIDGLQRSIFEQESKMDQLIDEVARKYAEELIHNMVARSVVPCVTSDVPEFEHALCTVNGRRGEFRHNSSASCDVNTPRRVAHGCAGVVSDRKEVTGKRRSNRRKNKNRSTGTKSVKK